jgi:integrase
LIRQENQDRFMVQRQGVYQYKRRVPKAIADLDSRAPFVRQSLKTDDLAKARAQRDILEAADNEYWAALLNGADQTLAWASYNAARRRSEALGFKYLPASEVAGLPLDDLLSRLKAMSDPRTPVATEAAVLGGVERPKVKVTEAFKVYVEQIAAVEIAGKSDEQKESWKKVKGYAVDAFNEVMGEDMAIEDISRDDAKKFHDHYKALIAPTEKGVKRMSVSLGNRRVGDMRILHGRYFKHINVDIPNPFEGLNFRQKFKKRRIPYPIEFLGNMLMNGSLKGLNDEARHIALICIETGARPIEIRYLRAERIKLKDQVPHILVEPSFDPDEPHEVKTVASVRRIPLVGVALEAMKLNPDGFPRYRENGNALSQAINKYLRENKLRPTSKETLYSFRHTFEDRLKEGRVDDELRKILMGHDIDREMYGSGGSLKLYREELLKIVYPFDPAIV